MCLPRCLLDLLYGGRSMVADSLIKYYTVYACCDIVCVLIKLILKVLRMYVYFGKSYLFSGRI